MAMTVGVSPLVHIEIVVHDAEEAAAFLARVFGAQKTQEAFASFLSSPAAKVVHVQLGNVVLQFIEPIVQQGLWAEHLREKGPGVHNLTFLVDDLPAAVKALDKEGARVLLEMPFDWSGLFGSDMVRPDVPPVTMVGSEEAVGFRLELAESPVKGEQSLEALEGSLGQAGQSSAGGSPA
jgi:catechol 2,3-dioxygenase-like lactoylglutathione lyase family enzyme